MGEKATTQCRWCGNEYSEGMEGICRSCWEKHQFGPEAEDSDLSAGEIETLKAGDSGKPKIVVLCGSSRFVEVMAVCAWLIERDERAITMGLHLLPQWYRSPSGDLPEHHLAEHEGVREAMDELHLRKIDLADEVFVVNFDDYVGSSTAKEIEYARTHQKKIRWFTHDEIGRKIMVLLMYGSRSVP